MKCTKECMGKERWEFQIVVDCDMLRSSVIDFVSSLLLLKLANLLLYRACFLFCQPKVLQFHQEGQPK